MKYGRCPPRSTQRHNLTVDFMKFTAIHAASNLPYGLEYMFHSQSKTQTMSCAAGGYFWQLRKICLLCLIQVMWCYIPLLDLANETFIDILLDYLIGFCCECRQNFYCSNVEFMLFLYAYRIYYAFKLGGK